MYENDSEHNHSWYSNAEFSCQEVGTPNKQDPIKTVSDIIFIFETYEQS